jgi:urea transporter
MPLVAVQHPIDAATSATLTPASIAHCRRDGADHPRKAHGPPR